MGLFDALGDMAREKYDSFRDDPEGTIARGVSSSMSSLHDKAEKKQEEIRRAGERKARGLSDEQLSSYSGDNMFINAEKKKRGL